MNNAKTEKVSATAQTASAQPVVIVLKKLVLGMVATVDLRVLAKSDTAFYAVDVAASAFYAMNKPSASLMSGTSDGSLSKGTTPWTAKLSVQDNALVLTLTGKQNTSISWSIQGDIQAI